MTPAPILVLALATLAAASAPGLPRGSENFRLGMFRGQVDSAVAARKLEVISEGSAFLVCGSDDPAVEYEQYSFFRAPHGDMSLWKVTIGYRLATSREDLEAVLGALELRLGPPSSDSGGTPEAVPGRETPRLPAARRVIWADARTAVQLGARWGAEHERQADRMMVTWTDRRVQRLVDVRKKQGRSDETQ